MAKPDSSFVSKIQMRTMLIASQALVETDSVKLSKIVAALGLLASAASLGESPEANRLIQQATGLI